MPTTTIATSNLAKLERKLNNKPQASLADYQALKETQQAFLLKRLTNKSKKFILNSLEGKKLVNIFNHLDADEATDLIQLLGKKEQKLILSKLDTELRELVSMLILFPPDVAAGLMKTSYIVVEAEDTIETVSKQFKQHEQRTGKLPEVIVLKEGELVGYMPGHALGLSLPTEKVGAYYKKALKISSKATRRKIISTFKSNPHQKVIVTGEQGQVMGIIYSDDVIKLFDQDSSLYRFAGVDAEETVYDGFPVKIKFRYKWLVINLFTSFLAAFTVGFFEDTISKYILLAVYMPIVAGMGGNSATQTLAIMVRGLSQNQVDKDNIWSIVRNEILASLANGLLNGLIIAAIVLVFNRDPGIALVLSLAMVVNLLVAGFFGSIIPFIMSKLGKDPASSATIFITTATDVLGFLAFLGLATVLLD